ncbi:MAG: IS4 family transposase [Anaerolineae bacterium]|nr:IS4 family transposase [Anaerolineae bacterium]
MSDNRRVYRRIKQGLLQLYPKRLSGNQVRHLNTLTGMMTGIVQGKRCHFETMAAKAPDQSKIPSRVKRFSRYTQNEGVEPETYFIPFIEELVAGLAQRGTLVVVMDGSEVGRHCLALVVSLVYQGRALPLAWTVVKGNKGHFPETAHLELLAQVKAIIPAETDVIFLGDGEFDGTALLADIEAAGWHYVCRTAHNRWVCEQESWLQLNELGWQAGDYVCLPDVAFTQQAYGPVLVIVWWHPDYKEPIYLVSNFELGQEAVYWYRKRFRIETFFSDQKSRGFHLHKSHIADPQRLARLMIAACLAYIWIIFLGVVAHRDQWTAIIHRTDRCDLSLFQLGLRLLDHFLNEDLPILFAFYIPTRL